MAMAGMAAAQASVRKAMAVWRIFMAGSVSVRENDARFLPQAPAVRNSAIGLRRLRLHSRCRNGLAWPRSQPEPDAQCQPAEHVDQHMLAHRHCRIDDSECP